MYTLWIAPAETQEYMMNKVVIDKINRTNTPSIKAKGLVDIVHPTNQFIKLHFTLLIGL
jgi:hypothetical protein